MSKMSTLQKRSKELQSQMNSLRSDMNNRLDNYQRNTNERIQQLSRQMEQVIAAHDSATENRYYKLLNDFQRDVIASHNREMNNLTKKYNELKKELATVTHELETESRKIKDELEKIKRDIEDERKNNQNTSAESIRSLINTYNTVEKLPHETFFPNKFSTYQNYIISSKDLHNQCMYNSSVALAGSGKIMLELFQCDIENKSEEWNIAFLNYCNQAEIAKQIICSSKNRIYEYNSFSYDITDDKLFDYWSNREYSNVISKLQSHINLIDEIKRQGIQDYIKNTDNPISLDEFERRINELSYIIYQYNKICEFSLRNIHTFHMRTMIKDIIIECMENSYNLYVADEYSDNSTNGNHNYDDYKYVYEKYIKEENYKSVNNPDYRERYVIKMMSSGSDEYDFYIVPESLDIAVNNLNNFNINLRNTIYYQVIPNQTGTASALNNIYDEINKIIDNRLSAKAIRNYVFIPVKTASDKEKMSMTRVHFSSELSDDEKIIIKNNNMTWHTESQ